MIANKEILIYLTNTQPARLRFPLLFYSMKSDTVPSTQFATGGDEEYFTGKYGFLMDEQTSIANDSLNRDTINC